MSDWQVGDLALCINADPAPGAGMGTGLNEGKIYTITDVVNVLPSGPSTIGLSLAGVDMRRFMYLLAGASRFVKVTPPAADEFDRETIALMKERVA